MADEEQIIGYQAREMWIRFPAEWPQARQDGYLIRKNILKPLSTDFMVWNDVFGVFGSLTNGEIEVDERLRAKRPAWTGFFDLWENLEQLETCLAEGWGTEWKPCWIIAMTVIPATMTAAELKIVEHLFPRSSPPTLRKEWTFLGYDVSDGSRLSGLLNCGHEPSDNTFAPYLNHYHLFRETEPALAYKRLMDIGAKEHAPFYPYGLYLVRSAGNAPVYQPE